MLSSRILVVVILKLKVDPSTEQRILDYGVGIMDYLNPLIHQSLIQLSVGNLQQRRNMARISLSLAEPKGVGETKKAVMNDVDNLTSNLVNYNLRPKDVSEEVTETFSVIA
jgi:hypothetical protein